MENNKTSKKVFNVINLILICTMVTFLALYLFIDRVSPYFFDDNSANKFFMTFIIDLTMINAVRFIIEGIKTFNKNDDLALNNKELTDSNKVQKITFAVINALFVLAMVFVVVRPAQLSNSTIYSNAINSVFVLVPFAIFSTIRFLICKDNGIFAQGYKKPFKIAFIAGNILLLSAMTVHSAIAEITNKTLRLPAFEPSAFYAFLLSAFNGIKFIIDDIKSARKCERVTPLFWKSKPNRIMAVISALILSVATAFAGVFWYTHTTHYLYNDTWVMGKTAEQIEQRYGKYDKEFGEAEKGYCVDEGNTAKELPAWPQYYMISFNKDGIAYKVEVVDGSWGG